MSINPLELNLIQAVIDRTVVLQNIIFCCYFANFKVGTIFATAFATLNCFTLTTSEGFSIMKKSNLLSTLVASFAALTFSSMALADAPSQLTIDGISYGGTGCPQYSVSNMVSSDRKAFTLLFDEFVAEIGPGVPRAENRKTCQITLDLRFPQGWSYSIVKLDYRGFAGLDRGIAGKQQSTYYFMGESRTARAFTDINGPIDDDYHYTDRLGVDQVVWSPCGANRPLNIKAEVRLRNKNRRAYPDATGIMTLDSMDGAVVHKYGLQWRRCH